MKTKRRITNRRFVFHRNACEISRLHKMLTIVPCEQRQLLSVFPLYEYDNLDRQIPTTDSNGLRNETIYNSLDQVVESKSITNGQTKSTFYVYDRFGNVVQTTYADGTSISATYNDEGQKISETNQLGQTRILEYSETGQLTTVVLPGNLRYDYAYDSQGNQTLIRDPNGHETRFTYDENGNQLTRTLPLGFGADGKQGTADDSFAEDFTEYFEYDNHGRTIKAISFEGIITTYSYDDYGRLAKKDYYSTESNFNSGIKADSWTYKYDANGRIIQVNQNGRITNTDHTPEGYVASITTPEGTVSYTYDDFGRQLSVSDGTNTTTYTYDSIGRLSTVTSQAGITTYSYDVFGNLAKTTTITPANAKLTTIYEYDVVNRLTRLTNFSDANNNGVMDTGEGISQFNYSLNSLGNKTHVTETFWFDNNEDGVKDANVNNVDWTYDAQNRLIQEIFDHYDDEFDQTLDWTYDEVGNRLSQTKDKGNDSVIDEVTSYLYDVNDRLIDELFDGQKDGTFEKTTHYGYDQTQQTSKTVSENGIITSDTTFEYNSQGQMSVVSISKYTNGVASSIERTTYGYGSDGIRILALHEIDSNADGTYDTATLTEYLNDPNNHTGYSQVLKTTEYSLDDETRTVTKEIHYTIGLDQIAQSVTAYIDGMAQETETHYFTYDGHGSTRALLELIPATKELDGHGIPVLINASLALAQLYDYDAYGNALGFNPAEALTEYLYSGEQFDSKIGQQYLRARYYDPSTGRFNRLDSFFGNLSEPQSLHKYLYTYADPVNGIDPSGEFGVMMGLAISNLIGANIRVGDHVRIGTAMSGIFFKAVGVVGAHLLKGIFSTWAFTMFLNGGTEIRNSLYKSSEMGKGGFNATEILSRLRENVMHEWDKLTDLQKREVISNLHGVQNGLVAWDIRELAFSYKSDWTSGMTGEVAHETLTYKGAVYPVAEVNYILWGMINRLAYEDGILERSTNVYNTFGKAGFYRAVLGGAITMLQWNDYYFRDGQEPPKYETASGKIAWVDYGWNWVVDISYPAPTAFSLLNATPNTVLWSSGLEWSAGGTVQNRMLKGEVR